MRKFICQLGIVLMSVALLSGCAAKKMTNILVYRAPYNGEVTIKGLGEALPDGAVLLGSVSVGESGFTRQKNCTYQAVIYDAQRLAAGMGGNMIMITEHKEPSVWGSSCHQVKANVYSVPEK